MRYDLAMAIQNVQHFTGNREEPLDATPECETHVDSACFSCDGGCGEIICALCKDHKTCSRCGDDYCLACATQDNEWFEVLGKQVCPECLDEKDLRILELEEVGK